MILSGIPALLLGACTYFPLKPCTEAGSFDTVPLAQGDMQCHQHKNAQGNWVNHGKFKQFHPNEKLAVEGEFRDGVKVGTWKIYNDKGEQTTELNYNDKGVLILGGGSSAGSSGK
jgi:hypothetical protein